MLGLSGVTTAMNAYDCVVVQCCLAGESQYDAHAGKSSDHDFVKPGGEERKTRLCGGGARKYGGPTICSAWCAHERVAYHPSPKSALASVSYGGCIVSRRYLSVITVQYRLYGMSRGQPCIVYSQEGDEGGRFLILFGGVKRRRMCTIVEVTYIHNPPVVHTSFRTCTGDVDNRHYFTQDDEAARTVIEASGSPHYCQHVSLSAPKSRCHKSLNAHDVPKAPFFTFARMLIVTQCRQWPIDTIRTQTHT